MTCMVLPVLVLSTRIAQFRSQVIPPQKIEALQGGTLPEGPQFFFWGKVRLRLQTYFCRAAPSRHGLRFVTFVTEVPLFLLEFAVVLTILSNGQLLKFKITQGDFRNQLGGKLT